MHVNPANTTGDFARSALTVTKGVHHFRMARNEGPGIMRYKNVLVIPR